MTADELHPQVAGAIRALEKLPAKEREQKPSKHFVDNYNSLLELAREAMPSVDARRWQPHVNIHTPTMGLPTAEARFTEFHAFLEQMGAILAQGLTPLPFGSV